MPCKGAIAQYALAMVALICSVIINIFGTESETLNTVLVSIISSTVWGGIQRQQGARENPAS